MKRKRHISKREVYKSIYVLYTDDSILTGPAAKELDKITSDMQRVGLHLMVEGDISDFLGVKIGKRPTALYLLHSHTSLIKSYST